MSPIQIAGSVLMVFFIVVWIVKGYEAWKSDRAWWIARATQYALWDSYYEEPDSIQYLPKYTHRHYWDQYNDFYQTKRNNPELYKTYRIGKTQ